MLSGRGLEVLRVRRGGEPSRMSSELKGGKGGKRVRVVGTMVLSEVVKGLARQQLPCRFGYCDTKRKWSSALLKSSVLSEVVSVVRLMSIF